MKLSENNISKASSLASVPHQQQRGELRASNPAAEERTARDELGSGDFHSTLLGSHTLV